MSKRKSDDIFLTFLQSRAQTVRNVNTKLLPMTEYLQENLHIHTEVLSCYFNPNHFNAIFLKLFSHIYLIYHNLFDY